MLIANFFLIRLLSGDFDGSDNEYDDDNNEYGNSEAKEYGCQHWERKNEPVIAHVKEEKVWIGIPTVSSE